MPTCSWSTASPTSNLQSAAILLPLLMSYPSLPPGSPAVASAWYLKLSRL